MDFEGCELCGSREFHIDDGVTYCSNGHDQQRGPQVIEGDDDFGTQGKRIRNQNSKTKQKISKVYRGKNAYRLFLQAYQLILWKQCHALIHKGLPAELWVVVRDLWTLRVSKLLHRLEDPIEDQDTETKVVSEPETEDESGAEDRPKTGKRATDSPSLIDTICLCYLGMLQMRLPVRLNQLFRWIREEEIVYVRAIRQIPIEMKNKLTGEYHEALDTSIVLKRDALQLAAVQLCGMYSRSYGMSIAPINWSIILFQYIKELALPLEVYSTTKRLNEVVNFDFKHTNSNSQRRRAISYPEAQLMALVIIVVKLIYPFDISTMKRYPRSDTELAAEHIDWEAWIEAREIFTREQEPDETLKRGTELDVQDLDIFKMSPENLDQYMDWYQRTWLREEVSDDDINKEIHEMFPLNPLPPSTMDPDRDFREEQAVLRLVAETQAKLKNIRAISDEEAEAEGLETLRPGMQYQTFRHLETLKLSPVAESFHRAAAEAACLSVTTLLRAVFQTERLISLWRRAKKRAELFGEEMDLEAERGMPLGLEGIDRISLGDSGIQRYEDASELEEDEEDLMVSDSDMMMIKDKII